MNYHVIVGDSCELSDWIIDSLVMDSSHKVIRICRTNPCKNWSQTKIGMHHSFDFKQLHEVEKFRHKFISLLQEVDCTSVCIYFLTANHFKNENSMVGSSLESLIVNTILPLEILVTIIESNKPSEINYISSTEMIYAVFSRNFYGFQKRIIGQYLGFLDQPDVRKRIFVLGPLDYQNPRRLGPLSQLRILPNSLRKKFFVTKKEFQSRLVERIPVSNHEATLVVIPTFASFVIRKLLRVKSNA